MYIAFKNKWLKFKFEINLEIASHYMIIYIIVYLYYLIEEQLNILYIFNYKIILKFCKNSNLNALK